MKKSLIIFFKLNFKFSLLFANKCKIKLIYVNLIFIFYIIKNMINKILLQIFYFLLEIEQIRIIIFSRN